MTPTDPLYYDLMAALILGATALALVYGLFGLTKLWLSTTQERLTARYEKQRAQAFIAKCNAIREAIDLEENINNAHNPPKHR